MEIRDIIKKALQEHTIIKMKLKDDVLVSKNLQYLYAFGGEHNSVERYDIKNNIDKWELLKLKWPSQISYGYGFATQPLWNLNQQLSQSLSYN